MESTLGSFALRESFERRFRTNHTLFSAHLQEDGALEFKEDRHAQNVHTVKNLAFVVCRAKGRLRLAVLLGSGLVRSFGVLVFRTQSLPGQDATPFSPPFCISWLGVLIGAQCVLSSALWVLV